MICWAAAAGNAEIVSPLIEQVADISARDANGADALNVAEMKGMREVVELLKQRGSEELTRRGGGSENFLRKSTYRVDGLTAPK